MTALDFDALAEVITPAQLAAALGSERVGSGWRCPLPDHEDRNPSFSIFRDGPRTAAKCYGCDLRGSPVTVASRVWGLSGQEAARRLVDSLSLSIASRNGDGSPPEVVAEYDYVDEDGELLFQVVRRFPKDFRQRRPASPANPAETVRGDWVWSTRGVRRVLYNLPAVLAAAGRKPIFVVEGEKDADRLASLGVTATTCPGGAGKWRDAYSETLRNSTVVLVPDNDPAGRGHARKVGKSLEGVAASIRVLELPDLPPKGDISDWFDAGGELETLHQLARVAPSFEEWLEAYREPEPEVDQPSTKDGEEILREEDNGDTKPEPLFPVEKARFARFLASDPPTRRFVLNAADDGILPLGVTGLLAAMGGLGKSWLVLQMGVSVTAGLPFLGWEVDEPGAFLYLAGEDDDAELHRRGHRLMGHYARQAELAGEPFDQEAVAERLYVVSRVAADNLLTRARANGEVHPTPLVDRLIRSATEIPDLRVVVLDPASRFKGGKANHEEDATRFVEAAERICEATGATVLVTAHVSQAGMREGGGQEIVRGSTALVDGVRWVATLQRMRRDRAEDYGLHEEEADRYLRLEIPKSNYTPPFGGMWLQREAGGILVPTELTETPSTQKLLKADRDYVEIVIGLQALLKDKGPLTRNAIRPHAGTKGALKAGDQTVRSVIERAVREGYLLDVDGELHPPLEDGS